MKTLRLASLGICLLMCLLLVASNQGHAVAQGEKKAGPQWEYTVFYSWDQQAFNKLGADGWELCVGTTAQQGNSGTYIFKRPNR